MAAISDFLSTVVDTNAIQRHFYLDIIHRMGCLGSQSLFTIRQ